MKLIKVQIAKSKYAQHSWQQNEQISNLVYKNLNRKWKFATGK